jgi:hypothetical protein
MQASVARLQRFSPAVRARTATLAPVRADEARSHARFRAPDSKISLQNSEAGRTYLPNIQQLFDDGVNIPPYAQRR